MHLAKEVKQFHDFAEENRLLQKLKEPELAELAKLFTKRIFPKGTIIVRENAYKESGFYIIVSGWVKVTSYSSEGDEQIYTVLTANDFFGEMSLLEDKPTSAAVVAKTECVVYALDRSQFFNVLERHPLLTIELLKLLSGRIRSANRLVTNFAFMGSTKKLKMYFLDLVHRRGIRQPDGSIVVENIPTQKEIGSAVGHRRETVAREMKKLSNEKIIIYKRNKVIIRDEKLLQD
jgi:CRP-like cAMP-binding protein